MSNTHNGIFLADGDGNLKEYGNTGGGGGGGQANIRACYDESPALYAHAVGSYIYYDSKVYKALSAIAVGDTLVVDTNIELASIPTDTAVGLNNLPGSGGSGGGVSVEDEFRHYYDLCNRSTTYTKNSDGDIVSWTSQGEGVSMQVTITDNSSSKTITYVINDTENIWTKTAVFNKNTYILTESYTKEAIV